MKTERVNEGLYRHTLQDKVVTVHYVKNKGYCVMANWDKSITAGPFVSYYQSKNAAEDILKEHVTI